VSLAVRCNICAAEIVDHDTDVDITYELAGRRVLVGVGRRLDVCRACARPLEAAIARLREERRTAAMVVWPDTPADDTGEEF
jgi:hypothetical protein